VGMKEKAEEFVSAGSELYQSSKSSQDNKILQD